MGAKVTKHTRAYAISRSRAELNTHVCACGIRLVGAFRRERSIVEQEWNIALRRYT